MINQQDHHSEEVATALGITRQVRTDRNQEAVARSSSEAAHAHAV